MKTETTTKQTYLVPAILSFFLPGLGQLFKRHYWRAFTFWGLGIAAMILCAMLSMPYIFWQAIILILWIWNVYDSYVSNQDWK